MKRSYVWFFILSLSVTRFSPVLAQAYQKFLFNSNEWDIYADAIPVVNKSVFPFLSGPVLAVEDTVAGSYSYKKAYSRTEDATGFGNKPCLLREDTVAQKVYILSADSTNERILYDFSLVTGDSLYLEFRYENSPNQILKSGWYMVDSMGVVNTLSGPRTTWFLSNPQLTLIQPNLPHLTWIEGLGSTISPVYLDEECGYSMGFVNPQAMFYLSLVCVFHDSAAVFHDSAWTAIYAQGAWNFLGDSCIFNMGGSVTDRQAPAASLVISPNPVESETRIQLLDALLPGNDRFLLTLADLQGRILQQIDCTADQLKEGMRWNRNRLNNGLYFLALFQRQRLITTSKIALN